MSDDAFLTVQETAERLRCSPSTVKRAIRDRRLRAVEVSERVVRVPLAEYERFIGKSAGTVPELSGKG